MLGLSELMQRFSIDILSSPFHQSASSSPLPLLIRPHKSSRVAHTHLSGSPFNGIQLLIFLIFRKHPQPVIWRRSEMIIHLLHCLFFYMFCLLLSVTELSVPAVLASALILSHDLWLNYCCLFRVGVASPSMILQRPKVPNTCEGATQSFQYTWQNAANYSHGGLNPREDT